MKQISGGAIAVALIFGFIIEMPLAAKVVFGIATLLIILALLKYKPPEKQSSARMRVNPATSYDNAIGKVRTLAPQEAPSEDLTAIIDFKGIDLLIKYRDASGTTTERPITPKFAKVRMDRNGKWFMTTFTAYCHRRKAAREFRLGRIIEAADAFTGEVITDVELALIKHAKVRERKQS